MAQAVQKETDTASEQLYAKAQKLLRAEIRAAGLDVIIKNLHSGPGRPYVFAGAVRDALLSVIEKKRIVPKDFDIGIDGLTKAQFAKIGSQLKGQPNRYGGYRIRLRSRNVADIWRLEETIGIRLRHRSSSIENVLRSFVLETGLSRHTHTIPVLLRDSGTHRPCSIGTLAPVIQFQPK